MQWVCFWKGSGRVDSELVMVNGEWAMWQWLIEVGIRSIQAFVLFHTEASIACVYGFLRNERRFLLKNDLWKGNST